MIWIGDRHLNEILIVRILLLRETEIFLEVILSGILKMMLVQSMHVDAIPVMPVVIIIMLLKIAHVTNPDHLHNEWCSLKKKCWPGNIGQRVK